MKSLFHPAVDTLKLIKVSLVMQYSDLWALRVLMGKHPYKVKNSSFRQERFTS